MPKVETILVNRIKVEPKERDGEIKEGNAYFISDEYKKVQKERQGQKLNGVGRIPTNKDS